MQLCKWVERVKLALGDLGAMDRGAQPDRSFGPASPADSVGPYIAEAANAAFPGRCGTSTWH